MKLEPCNKCIFFNPSPLKEPKDLGPPRVGTCRYNAPSQISGTGTGWTNWEWPKVDGLGCGDLTKDNN